MIILFSSQRVVSVDLRRPEIPKKQAGQFELQPLSGEMQGYYVSGPED